MTYLSEHIWEGTTWKLMDGGSPSIDNFSLHVIQLMHMKALVMHSFIFEMNERGVEEMTAEVNPGNLEILYRQSSQSANRVGMRYVQESGSWV